MTPHNQFWPGTFLSNWMTKHSCRLWYWVKAGSFPLHSKADPTHRVACMGALGTKKYLGHQDGSNLLFTPAARIQSDKRDFDMNVNSSYVTFLQKINIRYYIYIYKKYKAWHFSILFYHYLATFLSIKSVGLLSVNNEFIFMTSSPSECSTALE